jgi:hypothetical protein
MRFNGRLPHAESSKVRATYNKALPVDKEGRFAGLGRLSECGGRQSCGIKVGRIGRVVQSE